MRLNPLLTLPAVAAATVNPYRIVTLSSGSMVQASSATVASVGVSTALEVATGEVGSYIAAGVAEVKLGGTVTELAFITADADGQGVAAAPAAGVNNAVIGRALTAGVSGDVIPVLVNPSQIQGA